MHGRELSPPPPRDLDEVCRAHRPMVRRALRRLGVAPAALDDATQDVFVVLLRRIDDFDRQRSLTNWLWGIAKGVASTHRRSRSRRDRLHAHIGRAALPATEARQPIGRIEAAAILDRFLHSLDEDKCTVFLLAELDGYSGPEIARRLDLNLNTVYARLRAARLRLREVARDRRRAGLAALFSWPATITAQPLTAGASAVLAAALVTPVAVRQGPQQPPATAASEGLVSAATRIRPVPAKEPHELRPTEDAPIVIELEEEETMHTSKTLTAVASVAVAGMLSTPAQAKPRAGDHWRVPASDQDADEAARVEGDGPVTEYIFDNDHLEGEVLNPDGTMVLHRRSPKMPSMLTLRSHFLPELIRLGTDV